MRRKAARNGHCERTGKVRFRDEASAVVALRSAQMTDRGLVKPVRVYKCEFCADWHLTSRKERT